jgi:hypothetical protein
VIGLPLKRIANPTLGDRPLHSLRNQQLPVVANAGGASDVSRPRYSLLPAMHGPDQTNDTAERCALRVEVGDATTQRHPNCLHPE